MARKDSYWAGYREYRYGSRKAVTLPRIFTGDNRKFVVNQAMDLMKDWRATPFENEATVRHGIRSALCIIGHSWPRADIEADLLVQEGLSHIGAERPSWDQGQRQYSTAEEDCNWCGVEIPEADRAAHRKARFCSAVCAKSALQHRDWETRWKESAIGRSAFAILHRDARPMRDCEYCGASYHPFNGDTKGQRYCSHDCSRKALRTIPECNCPTCGLTHRPRVRGRQFCSYECAMARPIEEKACLCCPRIFVPKNECAIYCSSACLQRHRRRRLKATKTVGNVVYLTREIFDSWFPAAALAKAG